MADVFVCTDILFSRLTDHVTCVWLLHRLCFMRLKLLLIAIETKRESGSDASIAINPGSFVKVEQMTQGFFIAQSADEVKRFVIFIEILRKTTVFKCFRYYLTLYAMLHTGLHVIHSLPRSF